MKLTLGCLLNKRRSCAGLDCSQPEFPTGAQKKLSFLLSLLLLLLRFLLRYQMSVRLGLVHDGERNAIWGVLRTALPTTTHGALSSLQKA
jgi:hypothetical protein